MARVPPSIRGTYLFGKESSYGSGGTANKDLGLIQSFSVAPEGKIEGHHGQGQSMAVAVKNGLVTPKGSYDLEYQHGRILEYAFYGGTTTHAETTGDWTHTLVWAETLPSLAWEASYENGTTDLVEKGVGLLFGSSTITADINGVIKVNGDWVAKTIDTSASSVTAAVVNTGAPLGGFECGVSVAGSTATYIQSWSITANANAKIIHGQGSRAPVDGSTHERPWSFRFKAGFDKVTDINRFLGGTTISATEPASFTNIFSATNGVALGSGNRALSIAMTGCQMKYTIAGEKGDFVWVDFDGVGIPGTCTCVDQVLESSW